MRTDTDQRQEELELDEEGIIEWELMKALDSAYYQLGRRRTLDIVSRFLYSGVFDREPRNG